LYCHVPSRALPIHLFRHFYSRMYRLATIHSVTDRQRDRRHYDANSRSYLRAVRSAKIRCRYFADIFLCTVVQMVSAYRI